MKIFVVSAILLALASAQDFDEDTVGAIFDGLLADEEIELSGEDYDERLAIFSLNYLSGGDVGIDMMYTTDELGKMNGAKMLPTLKSALAEELEKRGESLFDENEDANLEKRSYLNNARYLSKAVHQGVCGNCYLHTFVAALEMAYVKATGERVKFSEQEMTDCYNDGCGGGDYKMVSITMSYLDKLSSKTGYGKYLSKQVTCRMGSTPDALKKIKVVDFLPVNANTFERAIRQYGSVMTCMKWGGAGEVCDMTGYTGGIINYPAVPGGCDHAVLIVGYTPTAYIVRNSHGHNWGVNGHFYIRRGTNSCGIEQDMAVVVTKVRANKGIGANGCPPEKPNLCGAIHTCTAASRCASSISKVELEEREDVVMDEAEEVKVEEEVEEIEERELSNEDEELIEFEKREVRIPGEREKRDEEEEKRKRANRNSGIVPGKLRRMLAKRGVTDEDLEAYYAKRAEVEKEEIEELEERCADNHPACPRMKDMGVLTPAKCASQYKRFCPASCKMCGAPPKPKVEDTGEQMGVCIVPRIPNGRVTNGKSVLQPGEPLNIECRPGYVVAGAKSKCLIQDIFTNDVKDGRLLQECVKVTKGAALVGNGAGYNGDKSSYSVGSISFECDSWNKDVLRGILVNNKDAMELALGNHNFCRNPGGAEPVPFCLGNNGGSDVGSIRYCFGHAGCDTCAGATDRYGAGYCSSPSNTRFCLFTDKRSVNRVQAIQSNCAATCCRMAGC